MSLIAEIIIGKIGNSLGITLPKPLIDELHLKSGDKVTIEKKGLNLELKPIE